MYEPFDWPRNRRDRVSLGPEKGVYALFLRRGAELPLVAPPREGLIYIGKAAGRDGLARRCHFQGETRVHSPRKSLAVLLRNILNLRPVLARGKRPTWTLDAQSEVSLSDWMLNTLRSRIVTVLIRSLSRLPSFGPWSRR